MKKILILLLMVCSLSGLATNYYVATAANGGSDANTGLVGQPVLTLANACTKATASGDVINIGVGTFNETVRCDLSAGVSILGSGVTSIIICNVSGTSGNRNAQILVGEWDVPTNGNQSISYLTFDANFVTSRRGIQILDRSNVSINNCTFEEFYDGAIAFESVTTYATGNTVNNCIINNCGTRPNYSTDYGPGLSIDKQTGFMIYNNYFDNSGRADGSNGNSVQGLKGLKGLKMYNNTFKRLDYEASETWNIAVELWYLSQEYEIYNNTFIGDAAIDLVDCSKGTGTYGGKVYSNTFTMDSVHPDPEGGGFAINIESHGLLEDLYIYNNYAKNFSGGISVLAAFDIPTYTTQTIRNLYIYGNVLENIGITDGILHPKDAIQIRSYTKNTVVDANWNNINVYNNTITSYQAVKMISGVHFTAFGNATNVNIRNNIIQGFKDYPIKLNEESVSTNDTITTLSIENNLYYLNGTDAANFGGVTINSKTEQNNVTGNPLFVSASDFHLQSGSPCINTGINVGLPYVSSAPDIGAYERVTPTLLLNPQYKIIKH